jgi:hypothetical protein
MKQTAVEWLVEQIKTKHDKLFIEFYASEIEEAKEMEKQQIIEAFNKSLPWEFGEQYYNETFKKQ